MTKWSRPRSASLSLDGGRAVANIGARFPKARRDAFDDVYSLPSSPAAAALALRSGARLNHVEITLSNGSVLSHGGTGGTSSFLALAQDEYLSSVQMCQGKHNGKTRIFYAAFVTSSGRRLAGGSVTSECVTRSAPAGWQIVGFHGRSADEVDELGVIFAPRIAKPGPSPSFQLVSQLSGQCLDIAGTAMADGTIIEQWPCNGGDWQRWTYDAKSGLLRSQRDPRFCLDNSGSFADGASAILWTCRGHANQRFTLDSSTGAIGMRTFPAQVLDVTDQSTAAGAKVGTWTWWGGANQRWRRLP